MESPVRQDWRFAVSATSLVAAGQTIPPAMPTGAEFRLDAGDYARRVSFRECSGLRQASSDIRPIQLSADCRQRLYPPQQLGMFNQGRSAVVAGGQLPGLDRFEYPRARSAGDSRRLRWRVRDQVGFRFGNVNHRRILFIQQRPAWCCGTTRLIYLTWRIFSARNGRKWPIIADNSVARIIGPVFAPLLDYLNDPRAY